MSDLYQTSGLLAGETIESMRDAVLSMDRKGSVIMLNPAAERLLRVTADEVLGQSFAQTFIDRSELERLNDCVLEAIYDPATPHTAEIQIEDAAGATLHLVVRTNLLTNEEGEPVGVVAVIADVSERVQLLEQQLESARTQQQFGQFFLYSLGVMSIGTIVNNLLARSIVEVNIYTQAFAWEYLMILLLPSLFIIRLMKMPLRELGLSREGFGQSLKEGVVVSLVFTALVAILSATLSHYDMLPGKPGGFELVGTITYFVHSFLQELVARGFFLTAFLRFLNDRRGIKSVFLTSSLFGMFHLHFGFSAVILTLISGVVFGIFYLRNRNLAGVTLIHFMSGGCAFWFGLL
ncbi:PAS domain S-box protein [Endothiovibrio diazotrophicus]